MEEKPIRNEHWKKSIEKSYEKCYELASERSILHMEKVNWGQKSKANALRVRLS